MKKCLLFVAVAAVLAVAMVLGMITEARATVIITYESSLTSDAYTPPGTGVNLLYGKSFTDTLSNPSYDGGNADKTRLTNGLADTKQNYHITAWAGEKATYTLATSGLGYSISMLDLYTGWQNGDRSSMNLDVAYSTVAAPTVFLAIASPREGAWGFSKHANIYNNAGPLATGVGMLRFTYQGSQSGYGGIGEFVAQGSVPMPEPAGLGLIGVALLAVRKRRS